MTSATPQAAGADVVAPQRCVARRSSDGEQCKRWARRGAKVCDSHGGKAPQVRAAAARRVTLAEAMAAAERRHPNEVLADALHGVDVLARQTQEQLNAGQLDAGLVQALLDSLKTQAAMAKLVLDTGGGPEAWSQQEAIRQQADALARVCRDFAQRLGWDPDAPRVREAFQEAVSAAAGGSSRRPRGKMIEGTVAE